MLRLNIDGQDEIVIKVRRSPNGWKASGSVSSSTASTRREAMVRVLAIELLQVADYQKSLSRVATLEVNKK